MAPARIHPTAIVEPGATLDDDVVVGPFCYIGPKVRIGSGTVLAQHVCITGNTSIGRGNRIFQSAVIGEVPQDLKYAGEDTLVEIGDNNIIREFVTINKGTVGGGGLTKIGDKNLIMAYVHIAHDCIIGNGVIMANAATLAGHVVVEDRAGISGLSAVHHFVTIGTHSYIGGCSKINQDVPPYSLVDGNPSRLRGLNLEGLKRSGFDRRAISALKEAFRLLYRSNLNLTQAVEELASKPLYDTFPEVRHLVEFVRKEISGWRGRGREATRADRPKVGFNLEKNRNREGRDREGASG